MVVEATIGNNSQRSGHTVLQNSMMCDVLLRTLIGAELLLGQLDEGAPGHILPHFLMICWK